MTDWQDETIGNKIGVIILLIIVMGLISIMVIIGSYSIYFYTTTIDLKTFLYENQNISFTINSKEKIYNKNTSTFELNNLATYGEILEFKIKEEKCKFRLIKDNQRIGNTDFYIYTFKSEMRIKERKIIKEIKENKMNLSLGTWLMIIILIIIIPTIFRKLSLKIIFKPTKKIAKEIKKNWDES
jgi:hypothetical protein